MTEPDTDIVSAVLAGDTSRFAELVIRHERSVRALAFSILRNNHASEDAAQDAFVAAYQQLPALRNRAAFVPWLHKIARRAALRRRFAPAPVPRSEELRNLAAKPEPVPPDTHELLKAVMNLPDHEREVLLLRHFDGHDLATIAAILSRPLGTVTKQLSRAHARLRERLSPEVLS